MSNEEIINCLCGEDYLSSKFINLLKSYDLTFSDGLEIREELFRESEYIKGNLDERKGSLMRQFIGEIVILYRKNHTQTINLDKLASYVKDDNIWDESIDRIRTIYILENNYLGVWPDLNDVYLRDLVKFNLLGKYADINFKLYNIPSKQLEGKDIREYLLEFFRRVNLIDEIDEKHPKSITEAVDYLIINMNIEEIDRIRTMERNQYASSEHFSLGMWIRNEFGINRGINSKLLYDCYQSKYNYHSSKEIILFSPDNVSDIILKCLWDEVDENYDKIKNYDFTSKINRRKYRLDNLDVF